jgi:hypothetical protein
MLAYLGLGAGQEFIPYFLALLAFVWAAVIAVLQWPFFALLRLIRARRAVNPAPPPAQTNSATPADASRSDTAGSPITACAERST